MVGFVLPRSMWAPLSTAKTIKARLCAAGHHQKPQRRECAPTSTAKKPQMRKGAPTSAAKKPQMQTCYMYFS
jgi:hypothetical protein